MNLNKRDPIAVRGEQAKEALRKGELKQAAEHLEMLMVQAPDDSQWPVLAAECYSRLKNMEKAVELLLFAADICAMQGETLKAIGHCKQATKLSPESKRPLERLDQLTNPVRARIDAPPSLPRPPVQEEANARALTRARYSAASALRLAQKRAREQKNDRAAQLGRIQLKKQDQKPGFESPPPSSKVPPSFSTAPVAGVVERVPVPSLQGLGGTYSISVSKLPPAENLGAGLDIIIPKAGKAPTLPRIREEDSPPRAPDSEIPVSDASFALAFTRDALVRSPLFGELPKQTLRQLLREIELADFDAGEFVFRQGDKSDSMYVIVEGELSVTVRVEDTNEVVPVATLTAGAFFGEIGLISDQPRQATIVANSSCRLLRIDRGLIQQLMNEDPAFLGVLLPFLKRRLTDDLLATSPLFATLTTEEKDELRASFEFLELEPGSRSLTQDPHGPGLFLWLAGEAKLLTSESGAIRLTSGALFGHSRHLEGVPGSSQLETETRSFALWLAPSVLDALVAKHPELTAELSHATQSERPLQLGDGRAPSIELPAFDTHVTYF